MMNIGKNITIIMPAVMMWFVMWTVYIDADIKTIIAFVMNAFFFVYAGMLLLDKKSNEQQTQIDELKREWESQKQD